MKFRTEYVAEKAPFTLSPDQPVVMLGSCFAENIAGKMRRCLWNAVNPAGTLYNPLSIERSLRMLVFENDRRGIYMDSLFKGEGLMRSWLFDSKLAAETAEDSLSAFEERGMLLDSTLRDSKAMFMTFGTSWCYFLADREDYVVANCHKQPQSLFRRERVNVAEIVKVWGEMVTMLKERYPQLEIVFTVSPVRHLKDGFVGNMRSKAVLLLAIEELCRSYEWCHYFPAYEIVNDDLRDYRFYASDLAHPSEEAVEYIWEVFRATYLDPSGEAILKEGESILRGWEHRPLPTSAREPSAQLLAKEEARLAAILRRHEALLLQHPAMLPLPAQYHF